MNKPVCSDQFSVRSVQPVETVTCICGHRIFDGEVVRSRCVKLHEGTALCRCKQWVSVPVGYIPY